VKAGATRILGLALTIVFLVLALRSVELSRFVEQLKTVNYFWLIPSAVCTLLGYVLRTARWRVILSGAARAPLSTLFPVLVMGFATNNVLPGRLGEFWRAHLLGRKRNVSKTSALASVFVERVFDGLTLLALLALVSMSIQLPGWSRQVELIAAAIFFGATLGLVVLLRAPRLIQAPVHRLVRSFHGGAASWIGLRFDAFVDGLASLRAGSTLLSAAGLSVCIWLFELASYLVLSRGIALGLPATLEIPAIGLALVTINLGIMVPSGPGYLGTQEFFGAAALGVVGANPQAALALVVVSHVVQYSLITALGLVFFAREHLWPRQISPAVAEPAS
jgi:glycosyltransferase 2 family protein